ncbi:MAG: FkbM family methyltransferase [Anaerolineae bacterium]|nr:FkbM family methyltransferase [Phycisphaerae bacterium]
MKRTLTRWVKGSPLEPVARWVLQRIQAPPPPELPENANATLYAFMRKRLPPDSNCVDIGASFGGYLEQMLSIAPGGRHYAFEPIPKLAEELQRKFPAAIVKSMALSDRAGMAKFHYFPDVSPFSGLQRRKDVPYDERTQVIDVPSARLDDVLPPDLPIALVKVDVEGAELDVLRGATQTLLKWRPVLIIEHDTAPAAAYGATPAMLHSFLDDSRYTITTAVRIERDAQVYSREEFLDVVRDGKIYNFVALGVGLHK